MDGFLKNNAFRNVKIQGELASSDRNAAKKYASDLEKIVQDGRYTQDHIFNADETALF